MLRQRLSIQRIELKKEQKQICIVLLFVSLSSLSPPFLVTFVRLSCCCRSFLSMCIHIHTNVTKRIAVCVCVCVRICSCSRRLETTIAQVNGFAVVVANLTCLLFCCFYGLVWVLFCAGLRSLCLLLPRYRSLSLSSFPALFCLSMYLALALALLLLLLLLLGTIELCRCFSRSQKCPEGNRRNWNACVLHADCSPFYTQQCCTIGTQGYCFWRMGKIGFVGSRRRLALFKIKYSILNT